jgi:hypothetical protein
MLVAVCGGMHFALPADIVRGIAGEPGQRIEDTLQSLGVTSPVVEFGDLMAGESHPNPETERVVVCGTSADPRAFRVDRLLGLQDLDMKQFRPLPPHFCGPERQWFGGLFLYGERIALLVNPGWLLGCEPDAGPAAAGAGLRIVGPVVQDATVVAAAPSTPVTIADEVLGVMHLEDASDAEDLPWAEL